MKWIYLAIGWLSLALGILGIFLPLLPTTPFLLLTAFCFSKGSEKVHDWLLAQPYVGETILRWQKEKVIPLRAKLLATALMLLSLLYLWVFSRMPQPATLLLAVFMSGILAFLWSQKSR